MEAELQRFLDKLKSERRLATFDEAATKQGIVLPLLAKLGWDTYNIDEVVPEYVVGEKRVDYSLRLGNANKIFIEVKKPSEDLERHQDQLLNYSFQEGVRLASLTNGQTWWFYLPLNEGSWEQRKFYTIDIAEQSSEDAANKFVAIFSRDAVQNGDAVQHAEALYKGQQKAKVVKAALPEAWNKLVAEADELLIDLLSETAEKLCGYKADAKIVEQFLAEHQSQIVIGSTVPSQTRESSERKPKRTAPTPSKGYTGRVIEGFEFGGSSHPVDSWIAMLLSLCAILQARHPKEFQRVLSLVGRKRPYFSENPDALRLPKKLDHSGIFVETNLSANSIARICFEMVSLFGYSDSDLAIRTH